MARRQDMMAAIHDAENEVEEPQNWKVVQAARRTKAVSMALAGLTYAQIGENLGISMQAAHELVRRALSEGRHQDADQLRDVENARLDRAQAAIWTRVLDGDLQALDRFLRISERRAKLNGLDAPSKVQMSVNIRQEMEQALIALDNVLDAEVIEDAVDVVELEQGLATTHEYVVEDDEDDL